MPSAHFNIIVRTYSLTYLAKLPCFAPSLTESHHDVITRVEDQQRREDPLHPVAPHVSKAGPEKPWISPGGLPRTRPPSFHRILFPGLCAFLFKVLWFSKEVVKVVTQVAQVEVALLTKKSTSLQVEEVVTKTTQVNSRSNRLVVQTLKIALKMVSRSFSSNPLSRDIVGMKKNLCSDYLKAQNWSKKIIKKRKGARQIRSVKSVKKSRKYRVLRLLK